MSGDWNYFSNTTTCSGTSGTFTVQPPEGYNYWYPQVTVQTVQTVETKKGETKMAEWVVEKGKEKTRHRLVVSVSMDGNGAILSEEESRELAKTVCERLGLKFIGKA
jgi:hypothetical protein